MYINRALTQKTPSSFSVSPVQALELKLNQQLDVKVVRVNIEMQAIIFKILQSRHSIAVNSNPSIELKQGQNFQLEVVKLTPVAEFKLLKGNTKNLVLKEFVPARTQVKKSSVETAVKTKFKRIDKGELTSNTEQKIVEVIKQVLPFQEPPSVLLNQLIKISPFITMNEYVSVDLKRLAKEIIENLPQIKNLNRQPDQLKSLIDRSGLFLETKLTKYYDAKEPGFQTDFKNQLLKTQLVLRQEIEAKSDLKIQINEGNLLEDILKKTDNTLAKIALNQLASLPKEEGGKQIWVFDLPFLNNRTVESVRIEVGHDKKTKDDESPANWAVTITLTPPGLATVYCKISCSGPLINTRFWSDKQEVVNIITEHLGYLKKQFEKTGIKPGHMSAHSGAPVQELQQPGTNQNLFDQQV